MNWIENLFDTSDFPPRWQCGNWSEALGWTYIGADLLIAGAYFAIPISILVYFQRRGKELYFPALYWLFAAFILLCGIGHLVDATLFWRPWYRFSLLINLATALVSWATVIVLLRYLPEAVRLPGALRLSQERQVQLEALERAHAETQEREEQFRTLADHVPLVIFKANTEGAVDYINSFYTQITGRSAEQASGEGWMEAILPEDRPTFRQAWQQAVAEERPFATECRWKTTNGDVRWFMVRAARTASGSRHWVGFAVDITAQKEDAERQLKLERRLQEGQKLESLALLAGGIAHDFNNLLTGILGSCGLAQMTLPEQHPAAEHLQQIEQTTFRAADLCRQMLAYSGKGRFVVSRIDISQLIKETTTLIRSSISKKAVIRFHLEPHLPACEGDATQLRQVVMNLVINASEAIGDRSGFINIHTGSIRADADYLRRTFGGQDLPPGDYVYLEVSDNGCGMTPETVSRIFDPFFTTKVNGRGLGLAAVLGIIKGHKGAIGVYSEPGKGTTFKILLPACPEPVDQETEKPPPRAPWKSHGTILVVDDEETIRSVLSRILEAWGFRCLTAADGRSGIEALRNHGSTIRLVLMDLTMPRLDGVQAFREMRTIQPEVPVVLMSGFSEQEAVSRFTGRGLAGFVHKPFDLHQLESVLRAALKE